MSKPRVTITLGRSGQFVERGVASESARMRGVVSGGKRSMGDRIGTLFGSNARGKRQRGDGNKYREGSNTLHDSGISRNDLRLKLLRNRSFKPNGGGIAEHKQMVSRRPNPSKYAHSAVTYQTARHESETNGISFQREMPPRVSDGDLYHVNSQRNFNSFQSKDGFQGRSPDRYRNTSYEPSPQRNFSELQSASSFRQVYDQRAGQFHRTGVVGSSQPTDSSIFRTKSKPQTAKSVGQFVPTNYNMQKVPYMGEESLSVGCVASLLHRLDLGKYAIIFQAEEVDMSALKQMSDTDLKELGIPMGPRKKILLALLARGKRPPPP